MVNSSRNFLAPAVKFMIWKTRTPSDLSMKLRFYQIQINVDCEDVVGLKTDLNIWNVRLLVIYYVTYLPFQ